MRRQRMIARCVRSVRLGILVAFAAMALAEPARAQAPLHERIDAMLESAHPAQPAPLASDAEFVRRIYLDLIGTIPTADEARQFIDDQSPDKREKLIDRLLASPEFTRHMTTVLDVMWMERRPDKHVKTDEWRAYLHAAIAANRPLNELVREILAADGVDDALRPAAKFYLDREGEPNLLTRDVGRMFFGMDLQCAQCHDHPLVDDYYQADYYGIFAFLNRSFVFADAKAKKSFFAEKGEGGVEFKSVFTGETGQTGPRLPGDAEIAEPTFAKGEEYVVKPEKDVRPVPKFSRRAQLAEQATDGTNNAFNRNMANRLWAVMMGRGLFDPVDLYHSGNSPTHPLLLQTMADELVAMQFDVRRFLGEVARTRAYQRGLDMPENQMEQAAAAVAQVAALEAELKSLEAAREQAAAAVSATKAEAKSAEEAVAAAAKQLADAQAAIEPAKKAAAEATAKLTEAQSAVNAKQEVATLVADAAAKTQAVVAKFPGDDALAAAAKTFQTRADELGSQLESARQTATQAAATAKNAADQLAVAERMVATVTTARDAARKQAEAIAARTSAVESALATEVMKVGEAQHKHQRAVALAELHQTKVAADQARGAADQAARQLADARKELESAKASMPERQKELDSARTARDAAAKQLTETQPQLAAQQAATKTLAEALAQANAAAEKLPDDKALADAAADVRQRHEQEQTKLDATKNEIARLEAEAKSTAEKLAAAEAAIATLTARIAELEPSLPKLETDANVARERADSALAALDQADLDIVRRWADETYVAGLKPLSPEQMTMAVLQATGYTNNVRSAAEAELNKKSPLSEADQADAAKVAERAKQLEDELYGKLKGNVGLFVNLFGVGPGQPQTEFFATVDQSLFFANGSQILSWLNPSGNNLTARLTKL
ncbi:MAG: DUF1549 domain-containing protein, partial [Planctomycetales bacterium]|nr:DUF1549 domain-containing protein [Planctomycetales bacterium]